MGEWGWAGVFVQQYVAAGKYVAAIKGRQCWGEEEGLIIQGKLQDLGMLGMGL